MLLVFNYTGDRLNFGLASERARQIGYRVRTILLADDCAFYASSAFNQNGHETQSDHQPTKVGQRGLAGSYWSIRLANSVATTANTLDDLVQRVRLISNWISTYSVCLQCTQVPGQPHTETVANGYLEFGLGIHNERGVELVPTMPLHAIIEHLMNKLMRSFQTKCNHLTESNQLDALEEIPVALMVNNLGGCSQFELNSVCSAIQRWFAANDAIDGPSISFQQRKLLLRLTRLHCDTFVSSFSMHGFSISLLPLLKPNWVILLDASEREAQLWKATNWGTLNQNHIQSEDEPGSSPDTFVSFQDELIGFQDKFQRAVISVCRHLCKLETKLNDLDRGSGDADCGSTMASMCRALLNHCAGADFKASFAQLSDVISNGDVGGSSGAICSLLCSGASSAIVAAKRSDLKLKLDASFWSNVLRQAADTVSEHGGAVRNDRTLLDVIWALADILAEIGSHPIDSQNAEHIVQHVKCAAERTAEMSAKVGRAAYASNRSIEDRQVDPGAWAFYHIIQAALYEIVS